MFLLSFLSFFAFTELVFSWTLAQSQLMQFMLCFALPCSKKRLENNNDNNKDRKGTNTYAGWSWSYYQSFNFFITKDISRTHTRMIRPALRDTNSGFGDWSRLAQDPWSFNRHKYKSIWKQQEKFLIESLLRHDSSAQTESVN